MEDNQEKIANDNNGYPDDPPPPYTPSASELPGHLSTQVSPAQDLPLQPERVIIAQQEGLDIIHLEDGTIRKRTKKKGRPDDPLEQITIKRRFKTAKKKRGNVYLEKFWSLLSGDRPQNFRLYLWLLTLTASMGTSLFQTFQYIAKYESAPTSTLVTTADDKVVPLPAIYIEEPYYPYKTNESGANTLFLKRSKLFLKRDEISGDPGLLPGMAKVKTLPDGPEMLGGTGARGLGVLTMHQNMTGINTWREFYGSLSFIHDQVIEKCENSNGQECKPKSEDWQWDEKDETYIAYVAGGEWKIIWTFDRKYVYANVPEDSDDLMVPRPILVFYPNMTFGIGRYFQEQPYILLQLYSHLPHEVHFDDVIAHPGWHLSLLDLNEQRPSMISSTYKEKIIAQEWKVYPVTIKVRRKYKQSKKQKPCTRQENFSNQKCCDDYKMKLLEKHPGFRCRPPWLSQKRFFNIKIKLCQDQAEMEEAMRIHKLVDRLKCPCEQRCNINEFFPSVSDKILQLAEDETDADERGWSSGRIEFHFSMNMEKFEEVWSYDFMGFIGELGGTLGMLLGVSVLSIFELIETMLLKDEDSV